MPRTVTVTGSFERHGKPYPGRVLFIPDKLWTEDGNIRWANLAPSVWTDEAGVFTTELTATNGWEYLVICPAGRFRVRVPYDENGHTLKELIDAHRARPGAQDRQ